MWKTLQMSSNLPHGKAGEKSLIFNHIVFLVWTGSTYLQFRDWQEMPWVWLCFELLVKKWKDKNSNKPKPKKNKTKHTKNPTKKSTKIPNQNIFKKPNKPLCFKINCLILLERLEKCQKVDYYISNYLSELFLLFDFNRNIEHTYFC